MLPDGMVKIVFGLDESSGPPLLISGSGKHELDLGFSRGVSVLLTPLTAYRIFATPLKEMQSAPSGPTRHTEALLRLHERVMGRATWEDRFGLLDQELLELHDSGPVPSYEIVRAWQELERTDGAIPINQIWAGGELSRRQLERKFQEQTGMTPKEAAKIIRLQKALRLQTTGLPWNEIAAQVGYHDESHLSRTFKNMVGYTPGQFRAHWRSFKGIDPLDFLPRVVTGLLLSTPDPAGLNPMMPALQGGVGSLSDATSRKRNLSPSSVSPQKS
jgi:AraC-like DNA-binding protein